MATFAPITAAAVTASYDFSPFRKLVDVGGGNGTLLIGILKANPHLHGIVFDLPHAAEKARAQIAEAGLQSRCEAVGGDFLKEVPVDRRTINRRLASEGQSYSSILDAVRRDMVTSLVEKGQRPLNEIALTLGFSGLSAFSCWFSNRFGRSPSEWRTVNLRDPHGNAAL